MTEQVEWRRVYWQPGQPKGSRFHAEVQDAPCSGWQSALCLKADKHVSIFCPYSLRLFSVTTQSQEYAVSVPSDLDPNYLVDLIHRKLEQHVRLGLPYDRQGIATFLGLLGADVPQFAPTAQEILSSDPNAVSAPLPSKGGKPMATKLLKKVDGKSKVGLTLAYLLEAGATISGACEKFSTTRSNILSRLFLLNKDNGIGYIIHGDRAVLQMPVDAAEAFA